MLGEAYLAWIPSGLALAWAAGFVVRGRLRLFPALTLYLVLTSLAGVGLQIALANSFFGLVDSVRTAYSLTFFGTQIIALALLVSALLELATLHLEGRPRFQAAGHRAVRLGLMAAVLPVVGLILLPEAWISGWREFHQAQALTFGVSVSLLWALFWASTLYFKLQGCHQASTFGWIIAILGGGEALVALLPRDWAYPTGLGLSLACCGAGAFLAWRPLTAIRPTRPTSALRDRELEDPAVREALARLDRLDGSLDVI